MRNVKLMLDLGWLHGDLSAYNILYWEGEITLIDFPQVASVHNNSQAHFILQRDVERVCEYFQKQGVKCHPDRIVEDMWKRYGYMHRARMQDNSIDEEGNVARLG
jgi:RIO kinase 1